MKRLLTGLQPTGVITLGNYIGSIKQMVKEQGKYDEYYYKDFSGNKKGIKLQGEIQKLDD